MVINYKKVATYNIACEGTVINYKNKETVCDMRHDVLQKMVYTMIVFCALGGNKSTVVYRPTTVGSQCPSEYIHITEY